MMLDRRKVFENIHSFNNIIRSLNDEDLTMIWLQEGVPDDCVDYHDIVELYNYMTDSELGEEYENLSKLFSKLVKDATKDGYELWSYVGQKIQHNKSDEIIQSRQRHNKIILDYISQCIEKYPELRFQQILKNLNITDDKYFDEESCDTVQYMMGTKTRKKINE